MVRHRDVFLHLMHFLGVDVRWRVLGAVDHAGLQRLVDFRERQHLRVGAQRAHLRVEHFRRLDAHLQALEVGRRVHRLVGRHHLEAVVPVRQAGDALRLELLQQALADRPFGHRVQRRLGRENVWQVEHFEFLDAERRELRQRRRQHLHGAELERLHLFLVLVQLAVRVQFDLDAAVGVLFGQLLEALGGLALRRVGGDHVAELDDDRRLRECAHADGGGQG